MKNGGALGRASLAVFAESNLSGCPTARPMRSAMNVLPDVSAPHQILPPIESLSDDELIEETRRVLCAGTAFHIAAGRYFLALKDRFRGRFLEVVEMRFDESIDT